MARCGELGEAEQHLSLHSARYLAPCIYTAGPHPKASRAGIVSHLRSQATRLRLIRIGFQTSDQKGMPKPEEQCDAE